MSEPSPFLGIPDPRFDKHEFARTAVYEPCESCGTPVAGPALFGDGRWGFAEKEPGCVDDYWSRIFGSIHDQQRCQDLRPMHRRGGMDRER